jgi:hypothetical protein
MFKKLFELYCIYRPSFDLYERFQPENNLEVQNNYEKRLLCENKIYEDLKNEILKRGGNISDVAVQNLKSDTENRVVKSTCEIKVKFISC